MIFFSSGLNFQDLMARQGVIESLPKAPFILGFECSGIIEQVAEGVEKFKVRYICCIPIYIYIYISRYGKRLLHIIINYSDMNS